jgi:hypothetical protein
VRVLRVDAVFDVVVGALLLAATWDGLYDALDLPQAKPELWTQVAGGLLVGFGYLRPVAGAAAAANLVGAIVVVLWLLFGDLGIGARGTTLLAAASALLVVFALLEFRIATFNVAVLMPRS